MAKRQRASSSSLFLMELILSILFFCIAGTICISIFTRAHIMHVDSIALNNSVKIARDTAEIVRSCNNTEDIAGTLTEIYGDVVDVNDLNHNLIIYFDSDFASTSDPEAPYFMKLTPADDLGFKYNVGVFKTVDSSTIFELFVMSGKEK